MPRSRRSGRSGPSPIVIFAAIVAIGGGMLVALGILRHDPLVREHFGDSDFSFDDRAAGANAGGTDAGDGPDLPDTAAREGQPIEFDPLLIEEARQRQEKDD